ncbi:beta-N-acetylhexosaminidase [Paramicrobacterium sp. CJ85]|uniref:beta-N-acetylhexosaminidase n=1 Tax=Paramicrobacterium sp. CJ85 TaxID=3445355 RepID=UPI003F638E0E
MSPVVPTLIPHPHSIEMGDGAFALTAESRIVTERTDLGEYLAELLRPATGFTLPVVASAAADGDIVLEVVPDAALDAFTPAQRAEGYRLSVAPELVTVQAETEAGLFAGIQTLRQLLPAEIEARTQQSVAWTIPSTQIVDAPRYAYRGVMLDIARHFFGSETIRSFIDRVAAFKFNHLHLHLTDDQGWRLEIPGWPELTRSGAASQVGGGDGGFLTTEDYEEIVRYAASRHVTVVPEIDLPGHTNAALVAYPELAPAGVKIAEYYGTEVGFSTLDTDSEKVYEFIEDVLGHVASITPGPYIHIGGDESHETALDDYRRFIARTLRIAHATGKQPIGWHEIGASDEIPSGTVGQYWGYRSPELGADEQLRNIVRQGGTAILSPADVIYLDIRPHDDYHLGLDWAAGATPLVDVADWEPGTLIPGVDDSVILGIEAPLWTETVATPDDIDALVFPRLLSVADLAWSAEPQNSAARAIELLPRLMAAGIAYGPAGPSGADVDAGVAG